MPPQTTCPVCSASTEGTAWQRYRVCSTCRYHFQLTATERIDLLADPESFKASNPSLVSVDPLVFTDRVSYRDRLERARRETGLNEAVVTGTARINGRECVLAVFDFAFMGGSMGSVVGEKIALALELAAYRFSGSPRTFTQTGLPIWTRSTKPSHHARATLAHEHECANPTNQLVQSS